MSCICQMLLLQFRFDIFNALIKKIIFLRGLICPCYWLHVRCQSENQVLPYLGMVGRFHGDDPCFGDFQFDWVPFLYLTTIQLTLSFCRKNQFVSITFSSKDAKVGLTFYQNVLFNRIKGFCINVFLYIQSNWPLFSLILDIFDPSFSQNLKDLFGPFCFCVLNPATKNLVKYSPPTPPHRTPI